MMPSSPFAIPTVTRYSRDKEVVFAYHVRRLASAIQSGQQALYHSIVRDFVADHELRYPLRSHLKKHEGIQREIEENQATVLRQFLLRYLLCRSQLSYPGLAPDSTRQQVLAASTAIGNLPAISSAALPAPAAGGSTLGGAPAVPPTTTTTATTPVLAACPHTAATGVSQVIRNRSVEHLALTQSVQAAIQNIDTLLGATLREGPTNASSSTSPSVPSSSATTLDQSSDSNQCPVTQYGDLVTSVMWFLTILVQHSKEGNCADCNQRAREAEEAEKAMEEAEVENAMAAEEAMQMGEAGEAIETGNAMEAA